MRFGDNAVLLETAAYFAPLWNSLRPFVVKELAMNYLTRLGSQLKMAFGSSRARSGSNISAEILVVAFEDLAIHRDYLGHVRGIFR